MRSVVCFLSQKTKGEHREVLISIQAGRHNLRANFRFGGFIECCLPAKIFETERIVAPSVITDRINKRHFLNLNSSRTLRVKATGDMGDAIGNSLN